MDSKLTAPKTIDEYILTFPLDKQQVLQKIRKIIQSTAPEATEIISYAMPTFKYHGYLVYFAIWKKHCALYPASGTFLATMKDELKGYEMTKGSIHFPLDKPLPTALIKKIVKLRMKENIEKEMLKSLKKQK